MDYIRLADAAKALGYWYHTLFYATKRKSLQAVRINGILHTTDGWVAEYLKNRTDREKTARFNGKKTFEDRREEFSTKRVAKILGVKKQRVYRLIYTGQLKTIRRGSYHVVTQESIDQYLNKTEVIVTEYVV